MENYLDPAEILPVMEKWIRDKVSDAGSSGCVLGLSGGLDSSVLAAILKRSLGSDFLAVIMPCHSLNEDIEDATLVAEDLDIDVATFDLAPAYDAILAEARMGGTFIDNRAAISNVKPRLRMTTLYMLAQSRNYLVCGTGNRDEIELGYFTKYGDGGSDIEPLGDLLKGEVMLLAQYLEIPSRIIDKPPSAGLWKGQTDESEMGLTYEEIDSYFLGREIPEETRNRIERKIRGSLHKRKMPPICKFR